jgi:hypothetical protein
MIIKKEYKEAQKKILTLMKKMVLMMMKIIT